MSARKYKPTKDWKSLIEKPFVKSCQLETVTHCENSIVDLSFIDLEQGKFYENMT